MRLLHLLPVLLAPVVCTLSAPASADDTPDLARFASGRALKSNLVPPGKVERYGRAEILVGAPVEAIRREILAFNRYKELAPDRISQSRIVAKEGDQTDVYMQVPILGGVIVLWEVMRFGPVTRPAPGVERLEGTYVRGNLRTSSVLVTVSQVDARRSILRMDLLVLPNMAAPQSVIDEELRDAAGIAVEGLRDRAERRAGPPAVASAAPVSPPR